MRSTETWHRSCEHQIDMYKDPHSRNQFPRALERQVGHNRNRTTQLSDLILLARFERKHPPIYLPTADELMLFGMFFGGIEPQEDDDY